MSNDNKIRPEDWHEAERECQCKNCRDTIMPGDKAIRVNYRGVVLLMCHDCAVEQIGEVRR